MMDTPYRMKALVDCCTKIFGADHRAFIAIDISGEKQTFLEGKFSSIQKLVGGLNEKLNFVLVVDKH
jgi:16S rRNA C1402 (ribose-2'-O) methylase RsmI